MPAELSISVEDLDKLMPSDLEGVVYELAIFGGVVWSSMLIMHDIGFIYRTDEEKWTEEHMRRLK